MTEKSNEPLIKEYTPDVEFLFVQVLLSSNDLFVITSSIIDPKHYHDYDSKEAIKFVLKYAENYNQLPSFEQVNSVIDCDKKLEPIDVDKGELFQWFLNEYENFAKRRQLEYVIINDSQKLIEKNEYGTLEKKVKDATEISLIQDLGVEYFRKPLERIKETVENSKTYSTGFSDLDEKLYGGFTRPSLNLFLGQSNAGKSIFLQNIGLNYALQGMNVAMVTLELQEHLYALRLDAMSTNRSTRDVIRTQEETAYALMNLAKAHGGSIFIKFLPNGSTANDINAYLKELEIQKNHKIDVLIVDYVDEMHPSVNINMSDVNTKDKIVCEELIGVSTLHNLIVVSASQLNRTSFEEIDYNHSHIAGGISKIQKCDNAFGIYVTPNMREKGMYELQLMKTRTSKGVGQSIKLGYNPDTMKLRDYEVDDSNDSDVDSILAHNNKHTEKKTRIQDKTEANVNPSDIRASSQNVNELLNNIKKRKR